MPHSRLVVMVSGFGSNLQAIMDACAGDASAAQVVLVVSNRRDAQGRVRAQRAGIPTLYFPLKPYLADWPRARLPTTRTWPNSLWRPRSPRSCRRNE